ncbi:hypothetical protein CRG98_023885, partial [Punica granatum]
MQTMNRKLGRCDPGATSNHIYYLSVQQWQTLDLQNITSSMDVDRLIEIVEILYEKGIDDPDFVRILKILKSSVLLVIDVRILLLHGRRAVEVDLEEGGIADGVGAADRGSDRRSRSRRQNKKMKFYISASGIRRVTISNSGAGKGSAATVAPARRLTSRTLLPVVLVLGIVLPFLFVRVAFLVLESAAACSSSTDCIGGWRFFSGNDANMLREELTRALLEAEVKSTNTVQGMDGSLESFDELVKELMSHRQDIKAFAFKTKAM